MQTVVYQKLFWQFLGHRRWRQQFLLYLLSISLLLSSLVSFVHHIPSIE